MTDLVELQEALDNLHSAFLRSVTFPNESWLKFTELKNKFAAYRAEQEKKDKQLSDLMKRQPLPEAFQWITDFKSQYQHWTKKLKELLEK